MLLKEIKEKYRVSKKDNSGKVIYLYDKRKNSGMRMVYKYLVTAYKVKQGFYNVERFKETSSLSQLEKDVNEKVKSYEYDSEYYNPELRPGVFEELVVIDELTKKGFYFQGGEYFQLKIKSVYGKEDILAKIYIGGLDSFNKKSTSKDNSWTGEGISDKVKITLEIAQYSWISTKEINRDVKSILQGVDSLIFPLLLGNISEQFQILEKMNYISTDVEMFNINNVNVDSDDFKEKLIQNLEETLKKLN